MHDRTRNNIDLFLLSAIALFLEMIIIRWLSSEIRIFAYFKNLPLMASFLGFGMGFYLHEKSGRLLHWFPPLLLVLVSVIACAQLLGITHVIFVDPRQYFLLGYGFGDHHTSSVPSLLKTLKALGVIVSVFFLVVVTFAALTSRLGELLNREKPLKAYSINVGGSIVGIVLFSLISFLEWTPVIWFLVALAPLTWFFREKRIRAMILFTAAIAVTFVTGLNNSAIWSPYYRITMQKSHPGLPFSISVSVNYDGFQTIQDLSDQHLQHYTFQTRLQSYHHYNIPYALSRRNVRSVLILGGGTGNDAAAAIRNGAQKIDVVEIDPAIARLGRILHPEKPYSSDKVNLYIDDARSFLQKTENRYDLVIFATLDSHAAFSSLSSLRMDNFVFTEESLESVKKLLNPGGGIAINFFGIKEWLVYRHYNTLEKVYSNPILTYGSPRSAEIIFLTGNLFDPARDPGLTDYKKLDIPVEQGKNVEPTSDDWPFLFLEKRGFPLHYLMPLLIIFLLSCIPLRMSRLRLHNMNWHLFFMGAAFLLMETKAVTTLALIFGSTWLVNSIVIGTILFTILLANLLVETYDRFSFRYLYAGLFASLLINYFFPFDTLNHFGYLVRVAGSGIIIGLPIFFAALIFAKAFAVVDSPSKALAANLFGSLVGGLLEYLDMWTGLRWLNLLALVLYIFSAVYLVAQLKRPPATIGK